MSLGNNIASEFALLENSKKEWSAIFEKIRTESNKSTSSCAEAQKPQNKNLNRYRDVSPYDHSRIVLTRGPTDYINANLVKVEKANRQYILTQGPLNHTVSHFWLMVWEQQTKAVLMLNKLVEKKQEKCCQYWPRDKEHPLTMEDVGLNLEYVEQEDHSYYLKRVLRLIDVKTKDSRQILQFHYTTWPDFGVPSSPTAFLEFLQHVREAGVLEPNVGPAVVHCSAGIGRSGTFCLVDSCLVLIENFGPNSVDIKEILYEMRKYRMGLIQTSDQLRFSYQAIMKGSDQLQKENSTPTENSTPITQENHVISTSVNNSASDGNVSDSDEDGPPPLPPPRFESLINGQNGAPLDRPLPNIPKSTSLNDFCRGDDDDDDDGDIDEYIPSGPLPVLPADEEEISSEDELESETHSHSDSPQSEPAIAESLTPSQVRHRRRVENKGKLEAQVRDMKRRQQANEQWTQLKRSLYKPLLIAGSIVLGGGLIAYFYFKN